MFLFFLFFFIFILLVFPKRPPYISWNHGHQFFPLNFFIFEFFFICENASQVLKGNERMTFASPPLFLLRLVALQLVCVCVCVTQDLATGNPPNRMKAAFPSGLIPEMRCRLSPKNGRGLWPEWSSAALSPATPARGTGKKRLKRSTCIYRADPVVWTPFFFFSRVILY